MVLRTLTILLLAPIVILCTYVGGIPFYLLVLVLSLISLNEFYNLMNRKGYHPSYLLGNLFTFIFISFAQFTLKNPQWETVAAAVLTFAVIVTFSAGIFQKKVVSVIDLSTTILGMIYVGWLFSYLILIRAFTAHGSFFFFMMAAIWGNDITAYLVGKTLGKAKLIPTISPSKTVEGTLAGIMVCVVVAVAFGSLAGISLMHSIILGVIIGVVAQISDLAESMIKRDVGAKDSSSLLPGHGGMLDRIDSFILSAPIIYYYIIWFVL